MINLKGLGVCPYPIQTHPRIPTRVRIMEMILTNSRIYFDKSTPSIPVLHVYRTCTWPSLCPQIACTLHWRHNDYGGVSNHQHHGCLLNRLFRRRSKKTSKLRVTGLCVGNSPGPMNSPYKGPVTRKMFPFDDVIMIALQTSRSLSYILTHPVTHVYTLFFRSSSMSIL